MTAGGGLAIDDSAESMSSNSSDPQNRLRRFEEFESRIVMTAQAVASVLPDAVPDADRVTESSVRRY